MTPARSPHPECPVLGSKVDVFLNSQTTFNFRNNFSSLSSTPYVRPRQYRSLSSLRHSLQDCLISRVTLVKNDSRNTYRLFIGYYSLTPLVLLIIYLPAYLCLATLMMRVIFQTCGRGGRSFASLFFSSFDRHPALSVFEYLHKSYWGWLTSLRFPEWLLIIFFCCGGKVSKRIVVIFGAKYEFW